MVCAAGRKFRRSGDGFRRKRRLCVNKCKSRVLGKIARMTVCAQNAHFTVPRRELGLVDGFVQRACCPAVQKGCVLFSIVKHDIDQPNIPSGSRATLFTRHVRVLSATRTRRFGRVVSHLGRRGPTSCTVGPRRARCFHKSCSLRIHPRCAFSIQLISGHATHYRCNGKRGLGACFVSSKYAGVMREKGRCRNVFPS